jgi:hypothetical protein
VAGSPVDVPLFGVTATMLTASGAAGTPPTAAARCGARLPLEVSDRLVVVSLDPYYGKDNDGCAA